MDMVTSLIVSFVGAHPAFSALMLATGFLRTVNKPLFALVQAAVDATETKADDVWWDATKKSKTMKTVLWVLDWTASVKLPKK